MADTVKCPNCGSNLIFDADTQKLTCSSCGTSIDPKELETDIDELESEASGAIEEDIIEYVCNACGAKVVTDKQTSASFCAFCGSPALIGQKLTKEFKPECIIPFKYGREKAIESFFNWCRGGRMTPFGFASDKNIEKLTGLYVPYWLSDVKYNFKYCGISIKDKRDMKGYGKIEKYAVDHESVYHWDNIPFDAETVLDDKLMEAIEPFDFKELVPYDYKYLPGFFADYYELTPEDLKERIESRAQEYVNTQRKMVFADQLMIETKAQDEKVEHSEKYALLPVWFLSYTYLGKKYSFVMNGQTGEVAGIPPVSLVKRLVLGAGLLAAIAVVARFIAGTILWGIVG